jgi:hypothetical protein
MLYCWLEFHCATPCQYSQVGYVAFQAGRALSRWFDSGRDNVATADRTPGPMRRVPVASVVLSACSVWAGTLEWQQGPQKDHHERRSCTDRTPWTDRVHIIAPLTSHSLGSISRSTCPSFQRFNCTLARATPTCLRVLRPAKQHSGACVDNK